MLRLLNVNHGKSFRITLLTLFVAASPLESHSYEEIGRRGPVVWVPTHFVGMGEPLLPGKSQLNLSTRVFNFLRTPPPVSTCVFNFLRKKGGGGVCVPT